jgi:hypothetical protein
MFKTSMVTTRDFGRDKIFFQMTEGREECPKCGTAIHVFIPNIEICAPDQPRK